MQRINSVTQPQGKAKTLLEKVRRSMRATPNMFTTLANSPTALEAYLNFNTTLSEGVLDPQLREQIALTVAGFNGCEYCASAHTFLGRKAGVDEAELQININGLSSEGKVQAGLTFARALVETRGRISDKDFKDVKAAGYSDEEIIEIVAHVALNTFTNYFNETVRTTIDFPVVSIGKVTQVA